MLDSKLPSVGDCWRRGQWERTQTMPAAPPSLRPARPTPPCHSLPLCRAHNEGECGKEGGEGGVDEGSHGVSWWVTPPHPAPTAIPICSRGISCCVDPHSMCLWILWLWRHSVQLGLLSGRRPGADPAPAHFSPT